MRTGAYAGPVADPDDDPREERAEPRDEGAEPRDEGTDRDLSVLEAAERELADLERQLDGLEGAEDPPAG